MQYGAVAAIVCVLFACVNIVHFHVHHSALSYGKRKCLKERNGFRIDVHSEYFVRTTIVTRID